MLVQIHPEVISSLKKKNSYIWSPYYGQGLVLSVFYEILIPHLIVTSTVGIRCVIIPILQIRILRLRDNTINDRAGFQLWPFHC